ncbi:MAG: dephospho-CoA kinase, partial [Lachnospiraceae bacterium]|nr:dephospho-CoA kinase [Lachnospiraceae bacterium]
ERVDRLISSRHYTIKKINEIIAAQMSDEEYISYADFVIDNSETLEYARKQIHDRLDERNYHKF